MVVAARAWGQFIAVEGFGQGTFSRGFHEGVDHLFMGEFTGLVFPDQGIDDHLLGNLFPGELFVLFPAHDEGGLGQGGCGLGLYQVSLGHGLGLEIVAGLAIGLFPGGGDLGMAAGAFFLVELAGVAALAASVALAAVHGIGQFDKIACFFTPWAVAIFAAFKGGVVAGFAADVLGFMEFMVKGNGVHGGLDLFLVRLGILSQGEPSGDQDGVGLISLEPGQIVQFFNFGLGLGLVAAVAIHRPCIFFTAVQLEVAGHAGIVGRTAVVSDLALSFRGVTVDAGPFLSIFIEGFQGFIIGAVVAGAAIGVVGF